MRTPSTKSTDESSYRNIASFLLSKIPPSHIPTIGIICGSGLSGLSKTMTDVISIPYSSVPDNAFPAPSVAGHAGEMVFGKLANGAGDGHINAICFKGRFHGYEGHDMQTVVLPVRVMRCLGVKFLIVTNAAGGLNTSYNVGDIVCVMDHLALPMLAGKNPLVGKNDDELGPRFPPTSNCYDMALQEKVVESAKSLNFEKFIRSYGTYCYVSGPQYESKAECRFLRTCGGDCVGMSTIPEVVAAHHCGMKVLCLSLITNKVVMNGDEGPAASHQEVLDAVNARSVQIQSLVKQIVANCSTMIQDELPALPPIKLPKYEKKKELSRCKTCGYPHLYIASLLGFVAVCSFTFGKTFSK